MNRPEFEIHMKRLVTEYTVQGREPPYGKERVEAVYRAFRLYSPSQFQAVIDRVFYKCKQAPLAEDLLKIAEEIRKEEHEKNKASIRLLLEPNNEMPKEQILQNVGGIIDGLRKRFPQMEGENGQDNENNRDMQDVL